MVFNQTSPDKDTGWGLIFRLNDLLKEVEDLSVSGRYDDWNFKLDRIFMNLLYREPCDIVRDDDGNIKEISLSKKDIEEKDFLDKKISRAKSEMNSQLKDKDESGKPKDRKKYYASKRELYYCMVLKDVWIRKLMHKNKLYIKELSSNPSNAMWGNK